MDNKLKFGIGLIGIIIAGLLLSVSPGSAAKSKAYKSSLFFCVADRKTSSGGNPYVFKVRFFGTKLGNNVKITKIKYRFFPNDRLNKVKDQDNSFYLYVPAGSYGAVDIAKQKNLKRSGYFKRKKVSFTAPINQSIALEANFHVRAKNDRYCETAIKF